MPPVKRNRLNRSLQGVSKEIETKHDAFFYLVEQRNAIYAKRRLAQDLKHTDAANALELAEKSLDAIVHFLAMTIDQEESKEE